MEISRKIQGENLLEIVDVKLPYQFTVSIRIALEDSQNHPDMLSTVKLTSRKPQCLMNFFCMASYSRLTSLKRMWTPTCSDKSSWTNRKIVDPNVWSFLGASMLNYKHIYVSGEKTMDVFLIVSHQSW